MNAKMSKQRAEPCEANFTGGLMPLIQALIKPPESTDSSNRNQLRRSNHPYYRKPGRGHNNDTCDSCKEGGDLLCCDRCPSSFHLGCHDPPLSEQEIPYGQWVCHTCKCKMVTGVEDPLDASSKLRLRDRSLSHKSSNSSGSLGKQSYDGDHNDSLLIYSEPTAPSTDVAATVVAPTSIPQSIASMASTVPCLELIDSIPVPGPPMDDEFKSNTPLDQLIQAAKILNPKQFELPPDMETCFPFPGTDKADNGKNGNSRRAKLRKLYELDSQGLVPLPARTCHVCGTSCRKAPLVACDYCDLLFHQDCLDPPLTAMPTSMWMCPNHVEQFIDWKMVNSISATERIRLWNRFTSDIDHETVKTEFLRKVHRKNPPFRVKQRLRQRSKITIPPAIEHLYGNPGPLLPSLKTFLRSRQVNPSIHFEDARTSCIQYDDSALLQMVESELQAIEEADEKLGFEKQNATDQSTSDDDGGSKPKTKSSELQGDEVEPVVGGNECNKMKENSKLGNANIVQSEFTNDHEPVEKSEKMDVDTTESSRAAAEKLGKNVDGELEHLDPALIRLLAVQRMQQIIAGNPNCLQTTLATNCGAQTKTVVQLIQQDDLKKIPLPSELLTKDDIERIAREFTIANGTSSSMIAKKDAEPGEEKDTVHPTVEALYQAANRQNTFTETAGSLHVDSLGKLTQCIVALAHQSEIRVRAALIWINLDQDGYFSFEKVHASHAICMSYRSFTIGSGPGNDVTLAKYGDCCTTSSRHAIIFYDEVTRMFELINYSEFGTEVNGHLYACDFSDHTATKSYGTTEDRTTCLDGLNDRRNIFRQGHENGSATGPILAKNDMRNQIKHDVESILEKSRKTYAQTRVGEFYGTTSMADVPLPLCKCSPERRVPTLACGWEGSAILYHGALIRFGCHAFIFNIVDYDDGADEFEDSYQDSDSDE